jgi:hypothetical protein
MLGRGVDRYRSAAICRIGVDGRAAISRIAVTLGRLVRESHLLRNRHASATGTY